ncbi:homoserine dehydrogenase [Bacillus sp. 31A1R]|uniref:Homoserine dehydrogenase n=1 Tax=Robertmurraya mangrovi TaxID=3098077 RepID=A0ABU5ITK3_9BACI|nr:homoserine dehydrogenase [Bacillus sp. 31A1R]MDZ5470461.1 homoserine dehydrogenase [Bacillus sp. 31A1R]
MSSLKVALLGLGTVGKGVYESIIQTHEKKLTEAVGKKVEIVGVLVKDHQKERGIKKDILVTTDVNQILKLPHVDIVFEAIVGIEPANTYIRQFLEKGSHVISANKQLLAYKGKELAEVANKYNRFLTFEAAVAGGIPLLRTIIQLLQVNGITKLEGILNGTSNYILSKMRTEQSNFNEVLKEAQDLGYAEADPSSDVLGTDAFYKLMILSNLIYQKQPNWENVNKVGVNEVSQADILIGERLGFRLKLVATLQKKEQDVLAEVRPVFVSNEHPLYNVEGVDNGIVLNTDLVGTLLLQGPGAGSLATASAMIEDLVYISQKGTPNIQTPRFSYNSLVEGKEEPSIWLTIVELPTDELVKEYKQYSSINFANKDLTAVHQEEIKHNDGYIIGEILVGKSENVERFIEELPQKIRIYPISPKGINIATKNVELTRLQTTTS